MRTVGLACLGMCLWLPWLAQAQTQTQGQKESRGHRQPAGQGGGFAVDFAVSGIIHMPGAPAPG